MEVLTEGAPVHQPVYRRIMDDIRRRIGAGELKPGDKLPSTTEMTEHYRCSAQPVKLALRMMQETGALEGHQGRGVYVAPAPS
jgi:DNA-binding GntR family transcriptional regulator